MTPALWQKAKRNWRTFWWKWKRRVKKTGLKLNIQKIKIVASGTMASGQIDGETIEQWQTLFSWVPKLPQIVTEAMKLKDICSLEEKLWPNETAY